MFSAKLTTGGRDLHPSRVADGGGDAGGADGRREALDADRIRPLVGQHIDRVERDQVDVAEDAAATEQIGQLLRDLVRVVDTGHQCVLERDAAAGGLPVAATGRDEILHRIPLVERYQLVPQGVIWRVQGDGQIDLVRLRGKGIDAGHHAGGRDRDPTSAEVEPVGFVKDLHHLHRRGVVVEGLAHPHHHDVGQCPPEITCPPCRPDHLGHHLPRREVAGQASEARRAEGAADRAPDLAGDANRSPVRVEHQHGFDKLSIVSLVEGLDCFPIIRLSLSHGSKGGERQRTGQLGPQPRRQVGHHPVARRKVAVQPGEDLAPAVRGNTGRADALLQLGQGEVVAGDRALPPGQPRPLRAAPLHKLHRLACRNRGR